MTAYEQLDDDAQAEALRPVALEAAAAFGVEVAAMEVALHAFNTTFRVDTAAGDRVALRVHTNSPSTAPQVEAQQDWQIAIAAQTTLTVPRPLATSTGAMVHAVASTPLGRPLLTTAASWLDGPDVDDPDVEIAGALGEAMATLHEQASRWTPPEGAHARPLDDPLLGGVLRLDAREELDDAERSLVRRALDRARTASAGVHEASRVRLIHADLHGGNLKWDGTRLAIFDFDDAGLGAPALDLAIATFYLRDLDHAVEGALREGYARIAPLPSVDDETFEALLVGRQLLLADSLLSSTTAELRAMVPSYLAKTVARLRAWERTGRFDLVSPGA